MLHNHNPPNRETRLLSISRYKCKMRFPFHLSTVNANWDLGFTNFFEIGLLHNTYNLRSYVYTQWSDMVYDFDHLQSYCSDVRSRPKGLERRKSGNAYPWNSSPTPVPNSRVGARAPPPPHARVWRFVVLAAPRRVQKKKIIEEGMVTFNVWGAGLALFELAHVGTR